MIALAQREIHALWWQPGARMAAGWWDALDLSPWRQAYQQQGGLRPALDTLLARRLGHHTRCPALGAAAAALLADGQAARDALGVALGLWALGCPDYLALRAYRTALAQVLDARALSQLQALLPAAAGAPPQTEPDGLLALARAHGAAWLSQADDPALATCRLYWEPSTAPAPATPVAPVLNKLRRWML